MPRAVNPGTLANGGGLAAQKSVEASAFVHPTQGLDGLIAHIVDPSRAHEARSINLTDAGGYYTSDNVEGALQEIGATLTAPSGLQNGVVAGCTFTSLGLSVTLATPSTVRIGTDRDMSAQIEVLDNNTINWLYVNPAGALVHSTGVTPPSISSPENILLWRIVTFGGAVLSSTDARFWVPNLDRKLPFTVRSSGTAVDSVAEACFVTLDAAMLYLDKFGAGVQQKTKLIIRGPHTLSSTVSIPQNDLVLEGDENAEFITGAALTPMFDLNAKSRITFQNILFTCNHATSVAIEELTGGNTELLLERCRFVSGGADWVRALNVQGAAGLAGLVVRACQIAATDVGIRVTRPILARVYDSVVTEVGTAGTVGISLGVLTVALTTEGQSIARGCTVTGFAAGVVLNGLHNEVSACVLTGCNLGVYVYTSSQYTRVKDCDITLDGTDGLYGVVVDSASDTRVSGCSLSLTRAAWVAEVPVGVSFTTSNDSSVVDCAISGFFNDVAVEGVGVFGSGVCNRMTVRGGSISSANIGVQTNNAGSLGTVVSGVDIRGVAVGVSLIGASAGVSNCQINLDATNGLEGIVLVGRASRVTACNVINLRAPGSYAVGDNPVGLHFTGQDSIAQGCFLTGFRNDNNPLLGVGYWVETDRCSITGGTVDTCQFGVVTDGDENKIDSINVFEAATGYRLQGSIAQMSNCSIVLDSSTGTTGIVVEAENTSISNCRVICTRVVWGGQTPVGIQFDAAGANLTNTRVEGFRNPGAGLGYGLGITAGGSFNVTGCTFDTCYNGLVITVIDVDNWAVTGNVFSSIDVAAIAATECSNITITGNTFESPGTAPAISLGNGTTDAVVSNNFINGDQITTTGIQIDGTDGGTTRSRRFAITGNTVKAVTTAGIFLNGYVQDGTVTSNQIDGFRVADPSNPTATGIRLLAVAVGALPKNITVDGNTVWRCARGITARGSFANPVHKLTFDGNTIHHCGVAQAGGAITSFATAGGVGIGIEHGRGIVISDNVINKIGQIISDADVEAFPNTGGTAVNSQGIYVLNTLGCSITGNSVTDSMSDGAGAGYGIFVRQASAGQGAGNTFSNVGLVVSANNILWNDALAGNGEGDYGVLITVDQGTDPATAAHALSNATVQGNTVRLVAAAGLRVVIGTESTLQGLILEGNTARESSVDGILVETTGTTPSSITQASVSGNTVVECTSVGIRVTPGGVGSFEGISIDRNTIADVDGHGIALIPTVTGAVVQDISVNENKLRNTSVVGSGIVLRNAIAATTFEHFTIRGNQITNAQDSGGDGIRVTSTDVALQDVAVTDNVIVNPSNVGTPGRGITVETLVALATSTALRRVTLTGNTVRTVDNICMRVLADGLIEDLIVANNILDSGISPGRPLYIETSRTNSANEFVEKVSISGNTCTGGSGSRLTLTNGNKLRGLTVANNQFSDALEGAVEVGDHAGFSVTVKTVNAGGTTAAISNLAITGNTFFLCEEQGLSLRFGAIGDEVVDDIVNVNVTGNTFTRCTIGAAFVGSSAFRYMANGSTQNLAVTGNTIADCPGEDSINQGVLHFLFSHDTGGSVSVENLTVVNNLINNCGGCGIKVEDAALGTAWSASDLKIDGNSIRVQTNDAIRLGLGSFVARAVSVSGNTLNTVSGAAGSDLGIYILGPTGSPLENTTVSNNRIREAGATTGGGGQILVSAGNEIRGLNVVGNSIDADNNTAGIHVESAAAMVNVVVNDNAIRAASTDGILITVPAAIDITTLSVCGNSIQNSGEKGIYLDWGTGTLSAAVVSNNSISGSGTHGMRISDDTAATIDGLSVCGNSVEDSAEAGILIFANIAGSTLQAITVSGNTVTTWNTSNGTSFRSGIDVRGDDATSVAVVGNSLVSTTDEAWGFHFKFLGITQTFNMSDNTLFMSGTGAANTQSMVFDSDGSTSQRNMSFTGNSFRGAVTGVDRDALSAFSPDRSVCAHNNERTNPGPAGNWATFAGYFVAISSITTPNQD